MEITYAGGKISGDEIIRYLTISGMSRQVFAEIIKQKEVMKKAAELGLSATDEELQAFADRFRRINGFHDSETTMRFLEQAGFGLDDFENHCEQAVLSEKVKDRMADEKRVAEFFVNNRGLFDRAVISEIVVADENLANELKLRIDEDDEDFPALARKYSIAPTARTGGFVGGISRTLLDEAMAAKIFNAAPGQLLGPFKTESGFTLVLVEENLRGDIEAPGVRQMIRESIFEQWAAGCLRDGVRVAG